MLYYVILYYIILYYIILYYIILYCNILYYIISYNITYLIILCDILQQIHLTPSIFFFLIYFQRWFLSGYNYNREGTQVTIEKKKIFGFLMRKKMNKKLISTSIIYTFFDKMCKIVQKFFIFFFERN